MGNCKSTTATTTTTTTTTTTAMSSPWTISRFKCMDSDEAPHVPHRKLLNYVRQFSRYNESHQHSQGECLAAISDQEANLLLLCHTPTTTTTIPSPHNDNGNDNLKDKDKDKDNGHHHHHHHHPPPTHNNNENSNNHSNGVEIWLPLSSPRKFKGAMLSIMSGLATSSSSSSSSSESSSSSSSSCSSQLTLARAADVIDVGADNDQTASNNNNHNNSSSSSISSHDDDDEDEDEEFGPFASLVSDDKAVSRANNNNPLIDHHVITYHHYHHHQQEEEEEEGGGGGGGAMIRAPSNNWLTLHNISNLQAQLLERTADLALKPNSSSSSVRQDSYNFSSLYKFCVNHEVQKSMVIREDGGPTITYHKKQKQKQKSHEHEQIYENNEEQNKEYNEPGASVNIKSEIIKWSNNTRRYDRGYSNNNNVDPTYRFPTHHRHRHRHHHVVAHAQVHNYSDSSQINRF